MFKARTLEDVMEDLRPKALKANEITELLAESLSSYKYKKLGLNQEERAAILYFDFPKTVDKSIHEDIKKLEEKTKWKIKINEQMNLNASDIIIRRLLKNADIKKISYHLNENKIVVALKSSFEITTELEEFKKFTGVNLVIQGEMSTLSNCIQTESGIFSEYTKATFRAKQSFGAY